MPIKRVAAALGALSLILTTSPGIASDNSTSQSNGDNKFVVRNVHSGNYFDVYVHNKLVFTVKEQNVDLSGGGSGLITDSDHDFYLSPDHRYLFVEQKSVHCYGVGTLYGPGPGDKVRAIRPHGMPFDSAAIRAFERVAHIPKHEPGHDEAYGDETRVIHFVRWTPHGVDFTVALANFYCGSGASSVGDKEYDWSGHYDFPTGRFSRMSIIGTQTHADYLREQKQSN